MFNEITQAIAREVRLKLTKREKGLLSEAREADPRAIRAYQNGRFHWYKFTPQDFKLAATYFEEAIEIDPKYAIAYVVV